MMPLIPFCNHAITRDNSMNGRLTKGGRRRSAGRSRIGREFIPSILPLENRQLLTAVDLSSLFNRVGIAADEVQVGGLDTYGTAYPTSMLGRSLTVGSATYAIGPAGAPDVVSSTG